MSNTVIYKPYHTIERKIPTSTIPISKIELKNDVPVLMDNFLYMREMMTLYQLALTPKQTNLVLKDLLDSLIENDLEEVLGFVMDDDRSKYVSTTSSIYIKNYTLQGAYADEDFLKNKSERQSFNNVNRNNFFVYNPKMVTNNLLEFIIDFTRPKSSYDSLVLKLPTIVSRAMTEFVYIISTLFQNVRVMKPKSSFWFKDTFILIARTPYEDNMTKFKNLIGMELSTPIESKKRITTFRLDKLDGSTMTSLLVDPVNPSFLEVWNSFKTEVYNEIYRYHKTVKMSVDSNNALNQYQLFLKNMNSIEAGKKDKKESFEEYLSRIHEIEGDAIPISRDMRDLTVEGSYNPSDYSDDNFRARGQVKLFLTEVAYLLRIYDELQTKSPKLLIYVGAAPGVHLIKLMEMFHNPSITWMLFDKAQFYQPLRTEATQAKYNIIIKQEFLTEQTIINLSSPSSVFRNHDKHVISDIRFTIQDEPTRDDLIRDYKIENDLVMSMQPKSAFLKWRYPYPENDDFSFSRVTGSISEEWLQPFAKITSSELRLFIKGPVYKLRTVTREEMEAVEKVMTAYKSRERYRPRLINKEDMILSSCRCNDCSLLNMLASDCRKKGINLSIRSVMEACGL